MRFGLLSGKKLLLLDLDDVAGAVAVGYERCRWCCCCWIWTMLLVMLIIDDIADAVADLY